MIEGQLLYCDVWLPSSVIMECLSDVANLEKIIMRDLFLEELRTESGLRDEVNGYLTKGELVPTHTVEQIILKGISSKRRFLLYGYPRTIEQFESFFKFCTTHGISVSKFWYFKTGDFHNIINDTMHFAKVNWSYGEIDNHKQKQLSNHDNFRRVMDKFLAYHKERWEVIQLEKDEFGDREKIFLRIKNSAYRAC